MTLWNAEGLKPIGYLSSVATAQPQSQKPVFDFDLTWWPDLWWPGAEIFTQGVKFNCEQVLKKWRRCAPPFFRYSRKPEGWAFFAPPPPVRMLIWMLLYIIRKQIDLRISSTINNYRIYIKTQEKGKNVLINSVDLISHRDVTSRISAVYVRSTRWRKFSKGGGRTDPKLAGYVHPGMCHVSFDPEGSKLIPQGSIFFFSLMPSSSDTLWRNFTKFGTGVQCNKSFQYMYNLGGQKIRGEFKILNFQKRSFLAFLDKFWRKKEIWGKKYLGNFGGQNFEFSKFWFSKSYDILHKEIW